MLAVDRRHRILERVAEQQTIHIAELAVELGVSEMTIRRDIARLERDGFLRRTHGGATAHITRSMELLFNARALENAPRKRLIGMRAAQQFAHVQTIFVGMGTTTEQFANYLPSSDTRTVITGSLPVATLLGSRRARVIALGGSVAAEELACVGPIAVASVRRYRADLALLGAAGLSAAAGLTELDDESAEVQRLMVEQSREAAVIADGSKIGATAMAAVAPAAAINTLITDSSAPAAELQALEALGISLVVLGEDGRDAPPTSASAPAPASAKGQ